MVAISTKGRGGAFLLDPAAVARAVGDRAIVVTIETGEAAWALSGALPKRMDVFGGATRIWWPGLTPSSKPEAHPVLFVWSPEEAPRTLRRLVAAVAPVEEAEPEPPAMVAEAAPAYAARPPAPARPRSRRSRRLILEGTVTSIKEASVGVNVEGETGIIAYSDEKLADLARGLAVGGKVRLFRVSGEPGELARYSVQGLRPLGSPTPPPAPPAVAPAAAPLPTGRVLDAVVDSLNGGRIRVRVGGRKGHVKFADVPLPRLAADLVSGQRLRVREVPDPGSPQPAYSVRGLLRAPWRRIAENYAVGDVVRARVTRVGDSNVLVELLPDAVAMVPFRELDWTYVARPGDLYRGGERVLVKLLSLEPEVHRCIASIKQAFGATARDGIAAGPGEEPFLGDAAVGEGAAGEDAGGEGGLAPDEVRHLREELESALEDREDLLRQRAATNDQLVGLKRDLRSAEDRLRALEDRVSGGLDPASSETSFLAAVRVEYARKFDEGDRARYPLQRMRVGREFLERLRALDGVEVAKVVEVCAQVASGRAHEVGGRSVHELRSGPAGSAGRVRAADGAKAWRASLQEGTPSARRLHWWFVPGPAGATVEFAAVVLHDDFSLPE